ncbi:DUF1801 domain-containing protein [Rhodophyticola sp. CCM32]|uniref:DUF1801 domain-containing protein n=1 Tax=Rhodophyticola sp. CCM32 TaxID=2916397 RepID=UPI00107FA50B|nr:DUF1801 domain-containing protein [Rhodophyticola sp. CCM32]QBY01872.1 DUF1801 domain-containing protein [Rhodophyticola sp. CCM32]
MTSAIPAFQDPAVAARFASFPDRARKGLLTLRSLIFETAADLPPVGPLEETLKWGQPAYLTPETKSGSTIRLGLPKEGGFAIYVHCQTTILSEFQSLFPDDFTYEGHRAIRFDDDADLPQDQIGLLIRRALTYHLKQPA